MYSDSILQCDNFLFLKFPKRCKRTFSIWKKADLEVQPRRFTMRMMFHLGSKHCYYHDFDDIFIALLTPKGLANLVGSVALKRNLVQKMMILTWFILEIKRRLFLLSTGKIDDRCSLLRH
jgi:hypothetical protein